MPPEVELGLYNMLFGPPPELGHVFDFDVDPARMKARSELLNTSDPDLTSFKQRGGKIIHYHGWSDAALTPLISIDYYEDVLSFMGETESKEFYKFYLVPGLNHCPPCGAPNFIGCPVRNCSDWLISLMNWVENGIAPDVIIDNRSEYGEAVRTRPLCPYPQVARYLGEGSINEAENFTCMDLATAEVRIMPSLLNLEKERPIRDFIKIPEGYDVSSWERIAVVCEGASADKFVKLPGCSLSKEGDVYVAKFDRQDLINILPGQELTFTVTAIFEHDGTRIAFEGSETKTILRMRVGRVKPTLIDHRMNVCFAFIQCFHASVLLFVNPQHTQKNPFSVIQLLSLIISNSLHWGNLQISISTSIYENYATKANRLFYTFAFLIYFTYICMRFHSFSRRL